MNFQNKELGVFSAIWRKLSRRGCAPLKCLDCGFVRHFYTSKMVDSDKSGMKSFEINLRTVYGMRAIGGGFSTKHIAVKSMLDAAVELRETQNTDIGVSIDGTWQKEGFVPLTMWLLLFRSTQEKYWTAK